MDAGVPGAPVAPRLPDLEPQTGGARSLRWLTSRPPMPLTEEQQWQAQVRAARQVKIHRFVTTALPLALLAGGVGYLKWRSDAKDAERSAELARELAKPPSPAAVAEARRLYAEARASAAELGKPRVEALARARATLAPRADLGPCPVSLEGYTGAALANLTSQRYSFRPTPSNLETSRFEWGLGIKQDMFEDGLKELHGEEGGRRALEAARAALALRPPPFDFALEMDVYKAPALHGDHSFAAGHVVGTLFLYDWQKREVVCAAHVDTEGSSSVKVRTSGAAWDSPPHADSQVEGDLFKSAVEEGAKALVKAGPKE